MIEQLLARLVSSYNINQKLNNQGKDAAFELLSCSIAFDKSPYYSVENCWNSTKVGGLYNTNGSDGKIDGYDIVSNDEKITIKLMQAKNTAGIETPSIRDFFNAVKNYIFSMNTRLTPEFTSLEKIRTLIKSAKNQHQSAIVYYEIYVVARSIPQNNRDTLQIEFESIFSNIDRVTLIFLSEDIIIEKINKIKKDITHEHFKSTVLPIKLEASTEFIELKGGKIFLGIVKAKEISLLITKEFETNFDVSRLFSGNVRGFLESTEVNNDIKTTIDNASKMFLALNNGAVIVCDKIVKNGENEFIITNPVIINGQQTFSSIYKYSTKSFQKNNILVPIKFIELTENTFDTVSEVSKASNTSNPIDDIDLLSNRVLIKKIKQHFSDNGLYLKIKQGEILNDVFFVDNECINFSELIKMWVGVYLEHPNDSKATKKNIKIFQDATDREYDGIKKMISDDKNFDILLSSLIDCANIIKNLSTVKQYFMEETYYSHAEYFIIYLFKMEFGSVIDNITNDNVMRIKTIIETLIENEKINKGEVNEEYTHNNYFKSSKPILDYKKIDSYESIDYYVKQLFSSEKKGK